MTLKEHIYDLMMEHGTKEVLEAVGDWLETVEESASNYPEIGKKIKQLAQIEP